MIQRLAAAVVTLACLGLFACAPPATGPDPQAVAANNRGVGLMGQFEYDEAEAVFAQLVQSHPQWTDARVNLAIATLNRQREGDEQRALALVDEVLAQEPQHLRAHYVAGLLRLYLSSPAQAATHFRRVVESDPSDAYAAYYLGQCLAQQGEAEQALRWFRQAMAQQPYLRSAYYGAFQALQRLRRADEAREVVADYQKLAGNPRARLAEFKYTRMGPRGEALAVGGVQAARSAEPAGAVFADPELLTPLTTSQSAQGPVAIQAVDIQGDGRLDLFVPGGAPDGGNLILIGQPDGRYEAADVHPLAAVSGVNASVWGDFDNDGRIDVYLCRRGANQLWRQDAQGAWADVTTATGTAGGTADTVDGVFFDADHDGDLDLFLVNGDAPNELLNNNLDGTFRPLAAERGIGGGGARSRTVVTTDLDGDQDVDIIVFNQGAPHEVYLNDRLWDYRAMPEVEQFKAIPVLAALALDADADGRPEIYTIDAKGKLWRWTDLEALQPKLLGSVGDGTLRWAQLAWLDANGDGALELLIATPGGWSVFSLGTLTVPHYAAKLPGEGRLHGVAPWVPDAARGPAVLAVTDQGLMNWGPGPGRYGFIGMRFSGREDAGQSMRSNASGIGTAVALRVGSRWTLVDTFREHSGPGQGQQPLAIGLGGAQRADFVAIDWSDGVFQSELGLQVGSLHRISETQRQLSSCPVLFVWDGERYAFVSDLLGVGGIGYAVASGEYATPRPWENFLLPEGLLRGRDAGYVIKIGEPMEETAYLDAVRLVSYDLPAGWDMVLDERMGIGEPQPTGAPRFFRDELLPSRAVNERDEDVTATVVGRDGRAAPVGALDTRFIGRLRGEHILTLEFPQPLDQRPGRPILLADGWVEYPYSQTMFAAWQAGAGFDAPTLEARGADGEWRPLLVQFGYPAGMPRRMSVPLPALPQGTTALRLRSNMEIYWDRLSVAYSAPVAEAVRTEYSLRLARVAKTGFAERATAAQRRPHYDYGRRRPFWDARYMAGFYTALGEATALLADVDDAVAVIGSGEEVHLEFSATEMPLAPGWQRRFVVETNGWAKDMDLFTRDGATVDPMPVRAGAASRQAQALHARYNTRFQDGR